jgi:putative membrane protein
MTPAQQLPASAQQLPASPAHSGQAPRALAPSGSRRPPLSRAERAATATAAVAIAGFAGYGFATHSPSTIGYVSSVLIIAVAVVGLRRMMLPPLLAAGLAIAAIVTLAGGLIRVGHDVLYNASTGPFNPALGTHYLQYDHFAHAYVSFVIVFACWVMLAAPHADGGNPLRPPAVGGQRGELVLLAAGAALGLGALNEMVEFIATLAHHGAHAGGYWNTGWDLIANFTGAAAAGLVLARSPARAA